MNHKHYRRGNFRRRALERKKIMRLSQAISQGWSCGRLMQQARNIFLRNIIYVLKLLLLASVHRARTECLRQNAVSFSNCHRSSFPRLHLNPRRMQIGLDNFVLRYISRYLRDYAICARTIIYNITRSLLNFVDHLHICSKLAIDSVVVQTAITIKSIFSAPT